MARCKAPWCKAQHLFCETKKESRFVLIGGPHPYLVARRADGTSGQFLIDGPVRLKRLRDALTKALRGVPKSRRPK
jgi:hypothetical protein